MSWQVTEETEGLRFNTGIAAMMEFVNGANKWRGATPRGAVEPFVLLLSPYAPHLAEELWQVPPSACCFGISVVCGWHQLDVLAVGCFLSF